MIGFTASLKDWQRVSALAPEDSALILDSGVWMTLSDLVHHTLVSGVTGCGKTEGVFLPMTYDFIRLGCGGLVIDVKGNLRGKIRRLASACGRAGDTVEYGISPTAMRINVISNMGDSGFYDFVKDLIERSFDGKTGNMDFHVKGAAMARDCFKMLRWLMEIDPVFEPTIPMIAEMFDDYKKATELFDLFHKKFGNDPEKAAFIRSVENSRFHILSQTRDKLNGNNSTHFEQLSYCTQAIKVALKSFLDTPGIVENFCRQGGGAPYMGDMLLENKIILLRFGPSTGPVGARLARLFMNAFYQAVYDLGLTLPGYRFVCVDEFQEVADLSSGRYSDTSFIAQTREFKVCFLVATQSASALMARGADENAVRAFLANCNNKIMFFSDDELTRAIASAYDPSVDLLGLNPGEAFVIRYESATRKHLWGADGLSNAYESMKKLPPELPAPTPDYEPAPQPALEDLLNNLKGVNVMNEKDVNKEISDAGYSRLSSDAYALRDEFPELFDSCGARISIPVGWRKYTRSALRLFIRLGLECRIDKLELGDTGLSAHMTEGNRSETNYLNRLLARTSRLCMLCGKPLPKSGEKSRPDDDDDHSEYTPPEFSPRRSSLGGCIRVDNECPGICPECSGGKLPESHRRQGKVA